MVFQIILISVVSIVLFLYYWSTSTFDYWKKRNVPFVKPIAFFGNFLPFVRKQENYNECLIRIYKSLKGHPFGGFFEMRTPVLCVRDPKLIREIMVTDFDHFVDRALYIAFNPDNKELNPLSHNLFAIGGDKCRMVRRIFSPGFTSTKLNGMLPQIENCIANIEKLLSLKSRQGSVEIGRMTMDFSIDLIGSCCFGLDCSGQNENSEFTRMASKSFSGSHYSYSFRCLLMAIDFQLLNILKIPDVPNDVTSFYQNIISAAVKYRETTGDVRKDFLQMMIDIRDKYKNKETDQPESTNCDRFDDADLAANAFIFFAAGFETTATTLTHTLYQLALNPDIQDKVRREIRQMNADDSKMAVNHPTYIDMVISESLRFVSPMVTIWRACTKDYIIPGTNVVLEKGTKVLIPINALHHDPEYYENPEKFDPERFSAKNKSNIANGSYLPFGDGPRYCIGSRFSQLVLRLLLSKMIEKYEFSTCDKTDVPLKYVKGIPLLVPENGVWLNVKEITCTN